MAVRPELIHNAVAFLRDPTVAASPLAKRLAFLESKGLTPQETDEALRKAAEAGGAGETSAVGWGNGVPRGRYGRSEEVARDWRDWFVMTVVGGTVGMVMYSLARKYLFPALAPPSQTDLQAAQAALEAKYDEAFQILTSLSNETQALRNDLSRQETLVQDAVKEVNQAVEECVKGEEHRAEEMDKVRDEVDALKDLLPRMMEKHKDAQTASLNDLQNELKSLKSLLMSRTPNTSTTASAANANDAPMATTPTSHAVTSARYGPSPSSPFSILTNRPPGIPAWQLAATAGSTSPAVTPPPSMISTLPASNVNLQAPPEGTSTHANDTEEANAASV